LIGSARDAPVAEDVVDREKTSTDVTFEAFSRIPS
jgi:hypothetical protein